MPRYRIGLINKTHVLGQLRATGQGAVAWVPPDVPPVTVNLRPSMLAMRLPYRRVLPLPDGTIDAVDRATLAHRGWRAG